MVARLLTALMIAFTVAITACTPLTTKPAKIESEREKILSTIESWQVSGKLGVRVPGDSGSANLLWKHAGDSFSLDINGPLGSGRLSLSGNQSQVTLNQAGQTPLTASDPDQLILQATGWNIPVSQLTWWVRGIAAPWEPIEQQQMDAEGRLIELSQAGWHLVFSQYQAVDLPNGSSQIFLPGKIIATFDDIRLTLISRDWRLLD